jgi:hypothetical protein
MRLLVLQFTLAPAWMNTRKVSKWPEDDASVNAFAP